jgi:hypothetical protein
MHDKIEIYNRRNEKTLLLELFLIEERGLMDKYINLRLESDWWGSKKFDSLLEDSFYWNTKGEHLIWSYIIFESFKIRSEIK